MWVLRFSLWEWPGKQRPACESPFETSPTTPRPTAISVTPSRIKAISKAPIACYRRAIEIDPNYFDAYNNLGNGLRARGTSPTRCAVTKRHSS